jgi:excisionase family DNA binding protein
MIRIRRKRAEELLRQQYYRPRELADLLGTSLDFINHEVSTRRLKARRLGKSTVDIPRMAVLEWLAERESPTDRQLTPESPAHHA